MITILQISELFSLTKDELTETQQDLKQCSEDLQSTKTELLKTEATLYKTRVDRDEQKHLVGEHVKAEAMLHAQATQVSLYVSNNITEPYEVLRSVQHVSFL